MTRRLLNLLTALSPLLCVGACVLWVPLFGAVLVILGGGCMSQSRPRPRPPRSAEAQAVEAAPKPQTRPAHGASEAKAVSIRDIDEMAERLLVTTVQLNDGGTYAPAYIDEDARLALLWAGVRMRWEEVPFRGPISGLRVVPVKELELAGLRVQHIRPPVRYLRTAGGTVLVGHYEPRNRVFYHWRGVTTRDGRIPAEADADAEVAAEAVESLATVVTVAPPPEARLP